MNLKAGDALLVFFTFGLAVGAAQHEFPHFHVLWLGIAMFLFCWGLNLLQARMEQRTARKIREMFMEEIK